MTDVTPLGTILKGRYQIIDLVKRGGMGAVFKAREINSGKIWALKELLDPDPNPTERENNLKMFQEEARLLSTLSHPNIPRVIAYFHDNNRHYLVMELVDGENLEEKLNKSLQEGKNLPQKQVLEWAKQVCKVFDYLHNNKPTIIFRDLKPANIMVTTDGVVKLIDFGIARTYKVGKRKDTFIFGTINYASPEHRGLSQTDHRSDIYTLGATLYHLLTGYPPVPFHTPTQGSLISKNSQISAPLEQLIIKSMAQTKIDRYQSAQEMLGALEKFALPLQGYLPPPTVSINFPTPPVVTPVPPLNKSSSKEKKEKYCSRCGTKNRIKAKYCSKCRYIMVKSSKKSEDHAKIPPVAVPLSPVQSKTPAPTKHSSQVFFEQGMKFFKEGAFNKAGQEFQKAIQYDTRNSRANFMIGRVYFEVGDYKQALNFFHRSVELEPNNAEISIYIGRASLELKDYEGAQKAFLYSIKLNPNSDETYRWLGKTYFAKKENQKAIEQFERVVQINPNNLLAYLELFYTCREMTYYHKGLQYCKKAALMDPNNPEVYFCLGLGSSDVTEFKEAMKYFKKALKLQPAHWRSNYHLGLVYRYLRKDSDAITEFKKALTLKPDYAPIYRALAVSYRQLGSISKAKKALEEAMRLDPHNPENKELMDSLRRS